MAPSTPPPPNKLLFAAFTMASTSNVVISACIAIIRSFISLVICMLVLFIYILNVRNIAKKLLCFKLKIVVLKACTCFLGGLVGDFGCILQSQIFIGIFYNFICDVQRVMPSSFAFFYPSMVYKINLFVVTVIMIKRRILK